MNTQTEDDQSTLEADTQTLAGDLMKFIYDEITQLPDVWQKIPAQQQNEIIDRIEKQARHNIERAVDIVLTDGRPSVAARLEKIEFKDGIKITLKAKSNEEYRHELADHERGECMVVLVNKDQYSGGPKTVEAEPDQRRLDLQDGEEGDLEGATGQVMEEVEDDELNEHSGEKSIDDHGSGKEDDDNEPGEYEMLSEDESEDIDLDEEETEEEASE